MPYGRFLGVLVLFWGLAIGSHASAQNVLWGTSSAPNASAALDQAITHSTNGEAAGQVEAAEKGIHFGSQITVNSIDVQSVLQVDGDNNDITSTQSGTNTGDVTVEGSIR